jgi:hypothetical protein
MVPTSRFCDQKAAEIGKLWGISTASPNLQVEPQVEIPQIEVQLDPAPRCVSV